jgi:hypothetical protein
VKRGNTETKIKENRLKKFIMMALLSLLIGCSGGDSECSDDCTKACCGSAALDTIVVNDMVAEGTFKVQKDGCVISRTGCWSSIVEVPQDAEHYTMDVPDKFADGKVVAWIWSNSGISGKWMWFQLCPGDTFALPAPDGGYVYAEIQVTMEKDILFINCNGYKVLGLSIAPPPGDSNAELSNPR